MRIAKKSNLDQERIDVCKQEIFLGETYTSFNHNARIILSLSTTILYIYLYYNFKQNCIVDFKTNAHIIVKDVLLNVVVESWCKLPEDGDNAETCRS
jgi:hypothetical protein